MKKRRLLEVSLLMGSSIAVSGGYTAVEDARQDLAERLQKPLDQITVVSQTEQDWPDASLGCPRKGMMYAQVISNGSRLVLDVEGRHYFYHSGAGKPYFYCASPSREAHFGTPRNDLSRNR